jgi:UDP-N-acetylmuramoylalanine--D-glutamate ligase
MNEAFEYAVKDAQMTKKNSNILLAPACASYDQFKNFEDRGNQFIELYDSTK